jgi:ATP-dependent exoDNAse (exonuclease V) beta subunit
VAIALNAAIDPESSTPPFDWASETARQIGTLVHVQLQLLSCDAEAPVRIRSQADYFRRWFAQRGVPPAQIEVATRRVTDSLLAIAEDERGRWILRTGLEQEARELGLSGVLEGRIVKIVLDRTFVDQGIRWIIDYKTSQHGGGEREQFLDNEVMRYAQQMRRYARIVARLGPEPIRLGLYFPLMRAWREWPADHGTA